MIVFEYSASALRYVMVQITQFELLEAAQFNTQRSVRAVDRFNGNQTKAAQYLGVTRKTLIYRMEKHGLRREGENGN